MFTTIPARVRALSLAMATIIGGGLLAGCAPSGEELVPADSVGIIVPVHDYAPHVTEDGLRDLLDRVAPPGTELAIYSSEGIPQPLWSGPLTYDLSSSKVAAARAEVVDDIVSSVFEYTATSENNNPLEAVLLIKRQFEGRTGTKTIIILDTLLQTTGIIALQDGSLYGEPADTVARIQESGYLGSDLEDVTVVLTQTGAVAPESAQPALDSMALKRLDILWTQIFEAAGATVIHATVDFDPKDGDFPQNAIVPVSPIRPEASGCTQALAGGQLNFLPDSAEFIDPAASAREIAKVADSLTAAGCAGEVVLIGTASSEGDADWNVTLSGNRALAVRGPLAHHLGVPPEAIAIVAAGYDERYCARDRDETGLVPHLAAACRQVIISVGNPDGTKESL